MKSKISKQTQDHSYPTEIFRVAAVTLLVAISLISVAKMLFIIKQMLFG